MSSILALSLILDYVIGWPNAIYQRIGHPAVWIGTGIHHYEQWLNHEGLPAPIRKLYGIGLVCIMILGAWILGNLISELGWLAEIIIAVSMLASKSLYDHVENVRKALAQNGVEAARLEVAKIVGRDTAHMNESQVSKAAIESLAESTCDGVIAPIFAYILGGLPAMLLFKAINTADSMVGYKTERYIDFGWASATLDDVCNFIPARLTALLYAFAARSKTPWRIALRDASKHASPNAGWSEAAMAGALNIQLGGNVVRNGKEVKGATFGDGTSELTADHIKQALDLYQKLMVILLVSVSLLALF